jgi:hypothetical protein
MNRLKLMVFLACAGAIGGAAPVSAQTMSFADAADMLVAQCGKDIERYCSKSNLGNGQLKGCLDRNAAKVSPGCKTAVTQIFAGLAKRAQARTAVMKICESDAFRLCQGVQRGDGNLLECAILARKAVSPACNQAITDAGYR